MNEEEFKKQCNMYYYGVWFVPGDCFDYLASLLKKDGKWTLEYRFRYYSEESEDPFDKKDKKNRYVATMKDDSDESLQIAIKASTDCASRLAEKIGSEVDFVDLQCQAGDPKFLFELGSRPWAHLRMVEKKDG